MKMKWKVWFHKSRSIAWLVVGVLSFPLHLANQVWFVTVCSLYANVASDWSASEAADDRLLKEMLQSIKDGQKEILDNQKEMLKRLDVLEAR